MRRWSGWCVTSCDAGEGPGGAYEARRPVRASQPGRVEIVDDPPGAAGGCDDDAPAKQEAGGGDGRERE